jgi:hypothetical protein
MIGAAVASVFYEAIRGGEEHAQGAPNDIWQALKEIQQTALTKVQGICILCGGKLRIVDKLRGRDRHKQCPPL